MRSGSRTWRRCRLAVSRPVIWIMKSDQLDHCSGWKADLPQLTLVRHAEMIDDANHLAVSAVPTRQ